MKNYTITVNGNVYNVTVEEGTASSAPLSAPAPVSAAPAPKAAPAKKEAASSGKKGAVTIVSPMPGKILGVKAKAGDSVKSGQVVLILEAMKMENEIVAPQDGTIVSIDTNEGASVEAGAVLATME